MDRLPAVAGRFYPADASALRKTVRDCLSRGGRPVRAAKALIAPHAGYIYSGEMAGRAFAALAGRADEIERVVLLGPAHRLPVGRVGASSASHFRTPLGAVPLDTATIEALQLDGYVEYRDDAHAPEHCLEVELPFLQQQLGEFRLIPLLVGGASAEAVEEILERLWGGPETLIVISTDLSHYHDYDTAKALDGETVTAIEAANWEALDSRRACGFRPLQGLLRLAARKSLRIDRLGLCNSGDTAGPRDRVVGYAAHALC